MFDSMHEIAELLRRVHDLMAALERDHLGEGFRLFLHYEMHSTSDKITSITQAASKHFIETVTGIAPR
eukprot:6185957-Pleurochrysis_carterae.AAC.1